MPSTSQIIEFEGYFAEGVSKSSVILLTGVRKSKPLYLEQRAQETRTVRVFRPEIDFEPLVRRTAHEETSSRTDRCIF